MNMFRPKCSGDLRFWDRLHLTERGWQAAVWSNRRLIDGTWPQISILQCFRRDEFHLILGNWKSLWSLHFFKVFLFILWFENFELLFFKTDSNYFNLFFWERIIFNFTTFYVLSFGLFIFIFLDFFVWAYFIKNFIFASSNVVQFSLFRIYI